MSKKILVLNGASYATAIDGLLPVTSRVSKFMENPEDFALVLFTGGEDVSPFLYHDDSPKNYCQFSIQRDLYEKEVFDVALANGIPMTGICRGVQFLNVMSGGTMMHHITGHAGQNHEMTTLSGDIIYVNSYHHQMVIPPPDAIVVGWATNKRSGIYIGRDDEKEDYIGKENEFVIFPKTKSFGVQYHPEMMKQTSSGYRYYYDMVQRLLDDGWEAFVQHYCGRETKYAKIFAQHHYTSR